MVGLSKRAYNKIQSSPSESTSSRSLFPEIKLFTVNGQLRAQGPSLKTKAFRRATGLNT